MGWMRQYKLPYISGLILFVVRVVLDLSLITFHLDWLVRLRLNQQLIH
jgi:hypothetical protein